MNFTAAIGYRRTDSEEQQWGARLVYEATHGLVIGPDGALEVIPLTLDEQHTLALQRDLDALSASFPSAQELLLYLHRKDSTIIPYGAPQQVEAASSAEAVERLRVLEEGGSA